MDPNGKLFNAKSEKGNVGLGDEKLSLQKDLAGCQLVCCVHRSLSCIEIYRGGGGNAYLHHMGQGRIWRGRKNVMRGP